MPKAIRMMPAAMPPHSRSRCVRLVLVVAIVDRSTGMLVMAFCLLCVGSPGMAPVNPSREGGPSWRSRGVPRIVPPSRCGFLRSRRFRPPLVQTRLEAPPQVLAGHPRRVARPARLDLHDAHVGAAVAVQARVRLALVDRPLLRAAAPAAAEEHDAIVRPPAAGVDPPGRSWH